jgi:Ring finger domain/IQ calmodulin-binding motif
MATDPCVCCLEEITASTGRVVLACSHSFHYNCLTEWFLGQMCKELPQNCPTCRHEAVGKERHPTVSELAEKESDSEADEEYEEPLSPLVPREREPPTYTWRRQPNGTWIRIDLIPAVPPAPVAPVAHVEWGAENVEDPPDDLAMKTWTAALKIQALWRGHHTRSVIGV